MVHIVDQWLKGVPFEPIEPSVHQSSSTNSRPVVQENRAMEFTHGVTADQPFVTAPNFQMTYPHSEGHMGHFINFDFMDVGPMSHGELDADPSNNISAELSINDPKRHRTEEDIPIQHNHEFF